MYPNTSVGNSVSSRRAPWKEMRGYRIGIGEWVEAIAHESVHAGSDVIWISDMQGTGPLGHGGVQKCIQHASRTGRFEAWLVKN